MEKVLKYAPRVAFFLAGAAVAALTATRRQQGNTIDPAAANDLKRSIAELEARLAVRDAALEERFTRIESRLAEDASRLAESPSTAQLVTAMDHLLSKTMASIDERLTSQAESIEALRTTVSQTDSLLERVLESLDSLQSNADAVEAPQEAVFR